MLTATKRTIRLTPAQDRALRTFAERRGLSPYRTLLMAIDAGLSTIGGNADRPADIDTLTPILARLSCKKIIFDGYVLQPVQAGLDTVPA